MLLQYLPLLFLFSMFSFDFTVSFISLSLCLLDFNVNCNNLLNHSYLVPLLSLSLNSSERLTLSVLFIYFYTHCIYVICCQTTHLLLCAVLFCHYHLLSFACSCSYYCFVYFSFFHHFVET